MTQKFNGKADYAHHIDFVTAKKSGYVPEEHNPAA